MKSPTHIRPRRIATFAVVAASLLAVLGGCGGDDGTATTSESTVELPTGTLSKAQLVKTADGLCTDATDRIMADAEPPEFGEDGPQTEEVAASAEFWRVTAGEGQVLLDQLSQLQPPKSEQEQWDEFLDLMETGTVGYADSLLGPAEDGDPDGFYQAALDSQKTLVELAQASQDLGLKVCGIRDVGS